VADLVLLAMMPTIESAKTPHKMSQNALTTPILPGSMFSPLSHPIFSPFSPPFFAFFYCSPTTTKKKPFLAPGLWLWDLFGVLFIGRQKAFGV
jgi:hypothetical protein